MRVTVISDEKFYESSKLTSTAVASETGLNNFTIVFIAIMNDSAVGST